MVYLLIAWWFSMAMLNNQRVTIYRFYYTIGVFIYIMIILITTITRGYMYLSIKPCCWKAITKKHGFSQSKILTLRRSFRRRSPPSGMLWMAMAKAMGQMSVNIPAPWSMWDPLGIYPTYFLARNCCSTCFHPIPTRWGAVISCLNPWTLVNFSTIVM